MPTDHLTTVLLKPGEADRIVAGHPWIYHTEILRLTAPVADGELVQVKDHRQRLLGTGFFNSKSKINVRVLSPDRVEVNEKFFEERIRAALAVRQKHLPDATSFRVVNAESDFLSGLIVDKYEDVLVVRVHNMVPKDVWSRRYEQINKFEELLHDNNVRIVKFFLHISKDEQKKRFQQRIDDPDRRWKISESDFDERKFWDDYTDAYEAVLTK